MDFKRHTDENGQEWIVMECMDCGREFCQPPHPSNNGPRYYVCPGCKSHLDQMLRHAPAQDSAGIYHGIRH